MNYVVDTNVISEVRKGVRCDPRVARWYDAIADTELYLSVLVLGEIRRGIELARPRDPAKAAALEQWLDTVFRAFESRIIPIDNAVAAEWGRISAMRTVPVIDGLLAATARVNDMTLVTRNSADIEGLGARTLDPFLFQA
ncbi:MAG: type II toxin-antitoxin system VapC family toxin [Aestuariivirga sp.]